MTATDREPHLRGDGRTGIPDPYRDQFTTEPARLTIVGLDLSLASTGVAAISGDVVTLATVSPGKLTGPARIDYMTRAIKDHVRGPAWLLIAMEGPSYGSKGGHAHERAGLWWIIRMWLYHSLIPVVVIPPACRIRYAVGTGNASKDRVLAAAIKRYPAADIDGHDQADALILAAMAADHYGHPLAAVPQAHRAALSGVKDWPDLGDRP